MSNENKEIFGEIINCDNMHTSLVVEDSEEKYDAAPPEYLAPAAEITHESNVTPNKRYYDGVLRFVDMVDGDGNVKIVVSGVPYSKAAELTGKHYNKETGELYDAGTPKKAPWRTLSGRMELAGGEYRYFNYLKGKFSLGAEQARTKEDNITVHTTELTFTPAVTVHKFLLDADTIGGVKAVKADTTDANFTKKDTWFDEIQTPPEVSLAEPTGTDAGAQTQGT